MTTQTETEFLAGNGIGVEMMHQADPDEGATYLDVSVSRRRPGGRMMPSPSLTAALQLRLRQFFPGAQLNRKASAACMLVRLPYVTDPDGARALITMIFQED